MRCTRARSGCEVLPRNRHDTGLECCPAPCNKELTRLVHQKVSSDDRMEYATLTAHLECAATISLVQNVRPLAVPPPFCRASVQAGNIATNEVEKLLHALL